MEITKDKVTELFCIIDEFLLAYVHTQRFQYVLPQPLSYGYEKELLFPERHRS